LADRADAFNAEIFLRAQGQDYTMRSQPIIALAAYLVAVDGRSADFTSLTGTKVTSLARLLACPEQYDGKQVQVTGYYTSGFEHSSLSLTKESAQLGDAASAVWIDLPDLKTSTVKRVRRGYVRVVGVFHSDPNRGKGHLGLWPSAIEEVTLFVPARRDFGLLERLALAGAILAFAACVVLSLAAFRCSRAKQTPSASPLV